MNLDTMKMNDKELAQLKLELEEFLYSGNSKEVAEFSLDYCETDGELVTGFYSGFKRGLFIAKYYPELLKEKEDEKKD